MEEGLMQTKMEQVSPAEIDNIFHDLIQELDGLLKKDQKINCHNPVEHDISIDRNLVKNILINLISNAIKFSNEKGIIKLVSSFAEDNFMISVEAKGIGISDEDRSICLNVSSGVKMRITFRAQV